MTRYLLGTDTCTRLLTRRPGYEAILAHLDGLSYGSVLISALTLGDIPGSRSREPGVSPSPLELFLARFEIADFDGEAAAAYDTWRAELEAPGARGGRLHALIAAQAIAARAVLVTSDVLPIVTGLFTEDWWIAALEQEPIAEP